MGRGLLRLRDRPSTRNGATYGCPITRSGSTAWPHGGRWHPGRSSHPHRAADGMHGGPRREGRHRRGRRARLGARDARNRSARSVESRRAGARDRVLRRQRVRARCGEWRDEVSRGAEGRLSVRRRVCADRPGRGAVRPSCRRQAAHQARRVLRLRGREGRPTARSPKAASARAQAPRSANSAAAATR